MTKDEAIIELLYDSRRSHSTTASAKRTVRACRVLGLDDAGIRRVMSWLEYCDQGGKPYSPKIEKVWP